MPSSSVPSSISVPPTDRTVLVVMGVAGSGKTTVARQLSTRLGWSFAEADDFHPPANITKMSAGIALDDDDRRPWLASIRDWIDGDAGNAVITCSALRRGYRDVLGGASARVRYAHLHGTIEQLGDRLSARSGHFMPASMLTSQLATLEPLAADEDGFMINIGATADRIVEQIQRILAVG